MNLPKAYIKGFLKAGKSPRLIFILYLSNLISTLIVALPFKDYLARSFGRSKLFENLLQGFDFTAFSNLMYYNREALFSIFDSVKWLALVYFLLSIFLSGGIIRILNKDKFSNADFFSGATFNFFRYLGLSILFIAIHIMFIIAIYFPLIMIIETLKAKLVSEIVFYYWVGAAMILHLLIFILVSIISDYSKFFLEINNSFNILKAFWKGVKYVFTHFAKTYFLYLFLLFLPAVAMYLYLYFEKDIKMALGIGILTVFAMQQLFILLRMYLRVWILASEFKMYEDDASKEQVKKTHSKKIKPVKRKESVTVTKKIEKDTEITPVGISKKVEEEPAEEYEEQVVDPKLDEARKKIHAAAAASYAIDFDKAFSEKNHIEADEKTLTEEEFIKKINYEEKQKKWLQAKKEDKIMRQEEEVYDEEKYEEPSENEIVSFDEDDTEEQAESNLVAYEMIEEEEENNAEKVRQNVMQGILQGLIGVDDESIDS